MGGADDIRGHRPSLALHHERGQRRGGEPDRRTIEHLGGGQYLAGLGLGHQPGGQVHRVPHHGEGPSERRAHVAGEHRAGVDADAQAQGKLLGGDLTQGEQHPLLVLAGPSGHARHQDDLAAVVVDVGPEERDVVLLGGHLYPADDDVEPFGQVARAVLLDDGIGAVEVEEGDRGDAVLGFAAPFEQVLPDRRGNVAGQIDAVELGRRDGEHRGRAGEATAGGRPLLGPAPGSVRSGIAAMVGLITISPAVAVPSAATVLVAAGPATMSSRCVAPDHEHVERAPVDADRDPQDHPSGRRVQPPGRPQPGPHAHGGMSGTGGVVLAGEQQEQRIPSELEQIAAAADRPRRAIARSRC